MNTVHRKAVAGAGLAAIAIFGAAACSNDSATEAAQTTTGLARAETATMSADPAANLVGPGKIDPANAEQLKTDAPLLTSILTYHVVPGQAAPADVAGEHETVEGSTVTVTGEGDNLMVDDAGLVCGGVETANATVYISTPC